jgi:hypothetical protein
MIEALRGLWILTHVAGRGVLCRARVSHESRRRVRWPTVVGSQPALRRRDTAAAIVDPVRGGPLPAMRWYTRALRAISSTGLVLGSRVVVGARDCHRRTDRELAAAAAVGGRGDHRDGVARLRAADGGSATRTVTT